MFEVFFRHSVSARRRWIRHARTSRLTNYADEIPKDNISETDEAWIAGPLEAPFGRGINLEMETDNVDELYDHVKKAGANIFLPIEEKWYRANDIKLGNRQFIVLDPDGYMLRFAQHLGERKIG